MFWMDKRSYATIKVIEMKYQTIGISGQSASGKTYFLEMLMSLLNNDSYSYIDLDGYHYHGRQERLKLNEFPEDINANDTKRIIADIKKIKSGHIIETPTYDHQKGDFDHYLDVAPKPIIFVEGLHSTLLNDLAGEKIIDFTIHINPSLDLQKTWKVHRDVLERGYDFNTVMSELKGRKAFEKKYIQPQIRKSDVIININKINLQIKHVLLLIQTNKLAVTKEVNKLFQLEEIKYFDKDYFHLLKKKEYSESINKIDQFDLLNQDKKILEKVNKNSIEDIVQISLGLILLIKANNYG